MFSSNRLHTRALLTVLGGTLSSLAMAQAWTPSNPSEPGLDAQNPVLRNVVSYSGFSIDQSDLRNFLSGAPREVVGIQPTTALVMNLPTPSGRLERFLVWENNVLAPELRGGDSKSITYSGQGIDDPCATVRFDTSINGFRAMVFGSHDTYCIEPMTLSDKETNFFVYSRKDTVRTNSWGCHTSFEPLNAPFLNNDTGSGSGPNNGRSSGGTLYTFRLAMNATIEYTAYYGNTVAGARAGIVTSVNRVDGVYRKDLCIALNLVFNNPSLGSDTFSNTNGGAMLTENQTAMNANPGSAAYDIGHVFSTGGGGVAYLGCVGQANKAGGVTGSGAPIGDAYDIDYVAHEMGHQFGGNHSFNGVTGSCGGGNRNQSTAVEPGSGSTIMGYAGICGTEDVQAHSDPYFSAKNLVEMLVIRNRASSGGVATVTGNSLPTVNAGADYTVPLGTQFKLTATGSDPNGETVYYCWEDMSVPAAGTANQGATTTTSTNTSRPMFRSFNPTTNATRFFPSQTLALANNFTNAFEFLPNQARTITFRCTARDQRTTGGGVAEDDAVVTFSGTAFSVTSPNTAVSWAGNSTQTITWTVGGGSVSPNVNIYLSTNGGASWFTNTATLLLANTPNDGTQTVTIPNTASTTARIIVAASSSIFYDISNTNFTITASANQPPVWPTIATQNISEESPWNFPLLATDPESNAITYTLISGPSGVSVVGNTLSWTPTEAQGVGSYNIVVRATDNGSPSQFADKTIAVNVAEVPKLLTGTVTLQGWTATRNGIPVTLILTPTVGSPVNVNTTLNASGNFSVDTTVAPGTYSVKVASPYFLTKALGNRTIASTGSAIGSFTLTNGDCDLDNEVGASDFDLVVTQFGNANYAADRDGDGEVGSSDFDLVVANFGLAGD